jgi:hypothetical protein
MMTAPRYFLAADGLSITCTGCGRTSWNPHDVAERYCGACKVFHDDASTHQVNDHRRNPGSVQ